LPKDLWASAAPDDPDRLLVCTFETDGERGIHHSVVYVSLDSGNTWMKTMDDTDTDFVSEPSCASGANSKAFFVAGASNTAHGDPRHEVGTTEIFRSVDGGLHWSRLHRYPFVDWTSLAVGGTFSNSVYVFGHLMAEGVGDAGSGAWRSDIRPLLSSHNAGEAFSGPRFPQDQKHNDFRRGYPVSAIALTDGTVVALYAEALDPIPDINSKLGLAVYKVQGEQYGLLSTVSLLPEIHDVEALSSQMAIDNGAMHHGRLYIAFQAVADDHVVFALSKSDDGGKTWNTKVLLRGDRVYSFTGRLDYSVFTSLAVNHEGIVGLEWMPPNGCPVFALSADGGASLTGVRSLGRCETSLKTTVSPLATIHCMDTLSAAVVNSPSNTSEARPGLTVRVDTSLLWSAQMVADAGGRFHAFWPERKPDGTVSILTSTVSVGSSAGGTISLKGAEDETTRSVVKVVAERFDPYAGELGIDLVVKNAGAQTMTYPALLEVSDDVSDCGKAKYLNAVASSAQGRALYKIPRAANVGSLLPGETTLPIRLNVWLDGCEDAKGSLFDRSRISTPQRWGFYTLSVLVRVYALRRKVADGAEMNSIQR
jgi:hypothetical protein